MKVKVGRSWGGEGGRMKVKVGRSWGGEGGGDEGEGGQVLGGEGGGDEGVQDLMVAMMAAAAGAPGRGLGV